MHSHARLTPSTVARRAISAGRPRPSGFVIELAPTRLTGQSAVVMVEVSESAEGWDFPFAGMGVAQLVIDYRLSLRLGGGVEIIIESPFSVRGVDGSITAITPTEVSQLAGALSLLHQIVKSASATTAGCLRVEFHDGSEVVADSDENYESWQVTFPDGPMYGAIPGEGVFVFPARS